jgi:pyruvate kinase
MLSAESATGLFPVAAVTMLAKIAAAIEPHRPGYQAQEILPPVKAGGKINLADLIAFSVETTLEKVSPAAIFVPTRSGATARSIARFHPPKWTVAVSSEQTTCQRLQFSYGVYPVYEMEHPDDWKSFIKNWLKAHNVKGDLAILTEGPSRKHPDTNNRMELINLKGSPPRA